jgi:hypothetical protein
MCQPDGNLIACFFAVLAASTECSAGSNDHFVLLLVVLLLPRLDLVQFNGRTLKSRQSLKGIKNLGLPAFLTESEVQCTGCPITHGINGIIKTR